jgi:hypothetical protein
MGDTTRARAEVARLEAYAQRAHMRPEVLAGAYASIGDRERAFEWLDRAFESRSFGVVWTRDFPPFDPLRSDPRFAQMLRRIGIE